jgi:hypothetical protein
LPQALELFKTEKAEERGYGGILSNLEWACFYDHLSDPLLFGDMVTTN